jgi:hypothetical protein
VQFSVADARTMLAQFAEAPAACGTLNTTIATLRVQITVTRTAAPALGDQAVALQVNLDFVDLGGTVSADLLVVRHGGTVIAVTNVEYPLQSRLTAAVADAAYAKVAARW